MMSSEQFESPDPYDECDDAYLHISLPFDQNRIITPIPEILEPVYTSANCGRPVRIFGGTFLQLNEPMTSLADVYISDMIGVIVGEQRGRIMVFSGLNDFYIGWLSPEDYEFITPFNMEHKVRWMQ